MSGSIAELRGGWDALVGRGPDFTDQPLGRNIDPHGLEGYWCDLRHKADSAATARDGLPRDGFGHREAWVIPLAQAALGFWEMRYDGQRTDRPFLALAQRLAGEAVEGPAGLGWSIDVAVPKYGLSPGWFSAMGQGQAISVLLRAHALTGDRAYVETARRALEPLTVPVAAGGLVRELAGAPVLEEYPTTTPCAVLNGWIFALLGVHELATVTGDEAAQSLLRASVDGLLALLSRYDVGWWSLYSLHDHGRPDLAKPFYQRLHPVMLDALALARPDPRLSEMADRWRAQIGPRSLARAALDKLVFRAYRAYASSSR